MAAAISLGFIVLRLANGNRPGTQLSNPLIFITIYATLGLLASFQSPKGIESLYWASAYLTVPIFLWALLITGNSEDQIRRVFVVTLVLMIAAVPLLSIFASAKLGYLSFIISPSEWIECNTRRWFSESSHLIRETGVGRYAALAALTSIVGLRVRNWGYLWVVIFVASATLLLYSGARTALLGFGVALPVILLLAHGRQAMIGGAVAGLVLIPIFWTTGVHQTFLDNCIWRTSQNSATTQQVQISLVLAAPQPADVTPITEPIPASPTLPNIEKSDVEESPPAQIFDGEDKVVGQIPNWTETVEESPPVQIFDDEDKVVGQIPKTFFNLTGRTTTWAETWELIKESPWLGRGFHADRFLLTQHVHNSYLHSVLQAGFLGGIPFFVALALSWFLLIKGLVARAVLSEYNQRLIVTAAGVMVFLTVRTIAESTGAFFSIDWLILAPLMVYVQMIRQKTNLEKTAA